MTVLTETPSTVFAPPPDAFAPSPAEARGTARDAVRLLVAAPDRVEHARFRDLADHLTAGDVVVVNNSATVAGELDARGPRGPVVLHLSTGLADGSRVVEVRTAPDAARSVLDAAVGERFVTDGATLTLREPYPRPGSSPTGRGTRLWRADVAGDLPSVLAGVGRPIAYGYLDRRYPLADYQSVFSTVPGSSEMQAAVRPFTQSVVTRLVARGVAVVPAFLELLRRRPPAGRYRAADLLPVGV